MRGYALENKVPITEQPFVDNEVTQTIIANRAFIAAMVSNRETVPIQRQYIIGKPEAVHSLPNNGHILPPEFYGQGQ